MRLQQSEQVLQAIVYLYGSETPTVVRLNTLAPEEQNMGAILNVGECICVCVRERL
jgi:hypothetical protein